MNFTPEQLARVAAVLRSNDKRFIALVRAAGLDPARDLVGADLQRVDFGADLYDGFDFAFTDLHGAKLDRAHGLRAAMFFRARFDETTLWPEGLRAEIAGFDVEAAARALILDGQAPPKHWEDMIRRLDLSASDKEWEKFLAGGVPQPEGGAAVFRRTELLANLRNLEYLDLSNTQVSDLSPIAHLYKLQSLNLKGTQVSDLAPIILNSDRKSELVYKTNQNYAYDDYISMKILSYNYGKSKTHGLSSVIGLSELLSLNISYTQITDLAPIAGNIRLQSLDLSFTQIYDLSPISGLTNMQILDLEATQVKNLTPIAKFNNLKLLILIDTQVHDLAPISGLSNLKCIDISNTEVNRLTGVEALQRRGVEVRNFGSEHPKRRN